MLNWLTHGCVDPLEALAAAVQQHAATFIAQAEDAAGADLPQFVKDEFDAFLECGILAHGFLRLRCGDCGHDKLVAFSCKRRGFCPSCGARRMAQTAAHLVDHVIPHVPVRQWVLSLPIPLRLLLAAQPKLVTPVLQVVHRVITRFLLGQAGLKSDEAGSGAVTLIQRFGSAANLNIHLHCLVLDGVYRRGIDGTPEFVEVPEPTDEALQSVLHKIITRTMKLLTCRGVLVEEQGSTYMADNDGDSDEARTLRPLQAAACTYRIAFGPRAGQKVLTVQGVMPRDADFKQTLCADSNGFSQTAGIAVWRSAGTRPLPGPCVRPHPARRGALRRRRSPGAGATVPLHHTPGAGQRTRTNQRRWPGRAEAEDTLARRHHPPGDVAAGVHAAVGGAGAQAAAAPDPLPRRAGTERQVARAGGAAGGAARGRGARAGCATRRLRGELCAPPPGAAELGKVAQARVRDRLGALPKLRRRAQDHCGHPGATCDREDPHAPGAAGAGTPSGASPWPGATSGLTLPNRDGSGDPMHGAAGVGCVRGFAGPMKAAW